MYTEILVKLLHKAIIVFALKVTQLAHDLNLTYNRRSSDVLDIV